MRTTIALEEDTYEILRSLAHQNRESLSKTVSRLLTERLRGVAGPPPSHPPKDALTGFPLLSSPPQITETDVLSLEDEA